MTARLLRDPPPEGDAVTFHDEIEIGHAPDNQIGDRALLREVGSFRSVRKFVDASLLAAVAAAGGAVYRTHGLGYLLRRNASGHTWEVDMDYLLDPSRVAATWEGFRPSRLLTFDESELP